MMKITLLVSVMLFSMVCAASMSCDSCGKECEASCGSRRFRACCFNYLRKKRADLTHGEEPERFSEPQFMPMVFVAPDVLSDFFEHNAIPEQYNKNDLFA